MINIAIGFPYCPPGKFCNNYPLLLTCFVYSRFFSFVLQFPKLFPKRKQTNFVFFFSSTLITPVFEYRYALTPRGFLAAKFKPKSSRVREEKAGSGTASEPLKGAFKKTRERPVAGYSNYKKMICFIDWEIRKLSPLFTEKGNKRINIAAAMRTRRKRFFFIFKNRNSWRKNILNSY